MLSLHHIKGEDKIEVLNSAFKNADKEAKGKLSVSEFKEVLIAVIDEEMFGHDNFEVDISMGMFFRAADRDGDGMVDWEELIKWFKDDEDPEEKMRTSFRIFDVNRNGKICKNELENLRKLFGDGENEPETEETWEMINKIMKKFDEDGDGVLNYQEFSKLMKEEIISDSD